MRSVTDPRRPPWKPAEDAIVRALYPRGPRAVMAALPNRSRLAILKRAQALRVHARPRWTRSDEALLRNDWHRVSAKTLCESLGRSWQAVRHHAYVVLRLPLGIPQGCMTVNEIAKRWRCSWHMVMTILRDAGIETRRAYGCPRPRSPHGWRYVSIDDAEHARRRYVHSETLCQAAEARRVGKRRMRAALLAEGLVPTERKSRAPIRVETRMIDEACKRHGIPTREQARARKAAA